MSRTPFHFGQFLYYTPVNTTPFGIVINILNEYNSAQVEHLDSGRIELYSFEYMIGRFVTEEDRDKFLGDDKWQIN